MVEKRPVPAPDEVPACFGDRHLDADPKCEACPVEPKCIESTERWAKHPSIAERLHALEASIDEADEDETVEEAYARLYQEFFGRKPRLGKSVQHARAFERVRELTSSGDIDASTYIAGNMWAMRDYADKLPYGFQPSMLSGEKALRRYHAYLGHLRRRYRHGRHSGKNTHTERGRLRRQLFEAEHEIAEWFVAGRIDGGDGTWDEAVDYVNPGPEWRAANGNRGGATYHKLCAVFGTKGLARERELATLRAACAIAEQHQHRLADRIGASAFDWPAFARLLQRILPKPEPVASADLSEIPGRTWPW